MNCYVNGKRVELNQQHFVAKGGEGSIFQLGGICYKIYDDPKKMIPVDKIKELQVFTIPNIVKPTGLIYDKSNRITGFTMDWLGDRMVALCKLFTNTFRDNNGITNDHITELVENIKNITVMVHEGKCLLVDGNEFNYLSSNDWVTPYFIDINSWQTPSYPATAIMPSIRDWTVQTFSPLTDWFSFAIVTFQLFVGIHPFKGRIDGFRKGDFEGRIKSKKSVLNPKVRVPSSTRDFSLIPHHYMNWYFKLFEDGERVPPPATPGTASLVPVKVILVQSTNNFEIREIQEFDDKILYHANIFGNEVTKTKKKIFIYKADYRVSPDVELISAGGVNVFVKIEGDKIRFQSLDDSYLIRDMDLECSEKMIVNNTLFLKAEWTFLEVSFNLFGTKIFPTVKNSWSIEKLSSQVFSGVVYQSVMGRAYLLIPVPNPGDKAALFKKAVPELDDYRIIDAKYMNRVCVVIGHKNNVYSRFTLIFDSNHNKYSIIVVEDIDYEPINMVVLDNGICVTITEDSAIEIFLNKISKSDVKRVEDPDIDATMRLCKSGNQLMFFKGNKLFEIKMK